MSDNFVIVIGRQFGSGGRTIGRLVAARLGIDYYDTELLNKAAEAAGLSPEIMKCHEEKKPSILKALLQGAYGIADNFHTVPLSGESVYGIQSKVIKEIASKGSCVIVGRNSDFILRDHPRLLSVFLHCPQEERIKRIMARREAPTEEEALILAMSQDKRREAFYNYFTGDKKWGVASNYHLSLDTSGISYEDVAELIISVAKKRFKTAETRSVAPERERKVRAT